MFQWDYKSKLGFVLTGSLCAFLEPSSYGSIRVSPAQVLVNQSQTEGTQFIEDAFYLFSDEEFSDDTHITALVGGKEVSLPCKRMSDRVLRCKTDPSLNAQLTEVQASGGTLSSVGPSNETLQEITVRVWPNKLEVTLPLVHAGAGELQPMDGTDQIYYWLDPKNSIIHGMEFVAGDLPIRGAERLMQSLLSEPQLAKFRMRMNSPAENEVFWESIPQESEVIRQDLLRVVQLDETKPGRAQVQELMESLLQTEFPEKRLQWELWLLKNYREEPGQDVKTVIIFRSHHAYSDGSGLVHSLFKGWGVDLDTVKYPGQRLALTGKPQQKGLGAKLYDVAASACSGLVSSICHPIQTVSGVYSYLSSFVHHVYINVRPPAEPSWSPMGLTAERPPGAQKIAWLRTPLSTAVMSKIAAQHDVKFNSVLFAIMTGAMQKSFKKITGGKIRFADKEEEQLHAYMPVSLRPAQDFTSKGKIIGNRLGAMGTPLYLEVEDHVERMRRLNTYINDFTRGAGMISIGLFSRLFSAYPTMFKNPEIMRKFANMYTAVFTTMPGPIEHLQLDVEGRVYKLEEMNYFIPKQLTHNIPIVFSSFSYAGNVQVGISLSGMLENAGISVSPEEMLIYVEEVYSELAAQLPSEELL